jgi:hypothetical protein
MVTLSAFSYLMVTLPAFSLLAFQQLMPRLWLLRLFAIRVFHSTPLPWLGSRPGISNSMPLVFPLCTLYPRRCRSLRRLGQSMIRLSECLKQDGHGASRPCGSELLAPSILQAKMDSSLKFSTSSSWRRGEPFHSLRNGHPC